MVTLTCEQEGEVLYRAVIRLMSGGDARVVFETYEIVRETPKGVIIRTEYNDRRFVRLDARKRFACPTKREALESFIARTSKRIRLKKAEISYCEDALRVAVNMLAQDKEGEER